jgi:hypothetical protein
MARFFFQALALGLAGLLTFIPAARANTPQSYASAPFATWIISNHSNFVLRGSCLNIRIWAAMEICFVLTDPFKGVGATVSVGEVVIILICRSGSSTSSEVQTVSWT